MKEVREGRGEIALHEEAGKDLESGAGEDRGVRAVAVEEQLRLDAVDARGVDEEFDDVVEEAAFDFVGGVGAAAGDGEGVADDGLMFLVDTEDVAGDAAVFDGDVAGEDAGVEILEKEIGGGAVVPAQALVPELDFGFEDGPERVRREVAKVEDLELERRCHAMPKCGRFRYDSGVSDWMLISLT